MPLLEPKEIEVKTLAGDMRKYTISKFPCIQGREIVAGYPITAMPQVSEYKANEAMMFKLMCYVAVEINSNTITLKTPELITNHVPDWETLAKIEIEMMRYNTSFLDRENLSRFFASISRNMLVKISPMLTRLLQQLQTRVKQP